MNALQPSKIKNINFSTALESTIKTKKKKIRTKKKIYINKLNRLNIVFEISFYIRDTYIP